MIIGISGKIGSGKDTVANIINYLHEEGEWNGFEEYAERNYRPKYLHWETHKFAGALKDCVCRLIGCTREDLEDIDFKNRELGEEWWYHESKPDGSHKPIMIPYDPYYSNVGETLVKLTPRKILQYLGTEGGRKVIHPNIWVNAMFANYRPLDPEQSAWNGSVIDYEACKWPSWIVTDMRFPNEKKAIEDRKGITIRVERKTELRFSDMWEDFQATTYETWDDYLKATGNYDKVYHPSETGLDGPLHWDYTIVNDGSIEDLIEAVRGIMVTRNYFKSVD